MSPPRRLSCSRETADLDDIAMKQAYLAAVPAIGFVQVWFSPDQVPFAEQTSSVAPFHRAAQAATLPRNKRQDDRSAPSRRSDRRCSGQEAAVAVAVEPPSVDGST